ncbi:MAG: phosphoribosylamine--glycine ligase [Microcoleaceae cyanobacterium]
MKVLVVGNGGREHTLVWKLLQSPNVERVICVPGNGGTAQQPGCENVAISVEDFQQIQQVAQQHQVDLVVVGPELPLVLGITDYLKTNGIRVFGPTQAGAQIEASKSWAKDLMFEAGIPTATSATFSDAVLAKAYIKTAPIVVKADGLAAGKGVVVANSVEEAHAAIDRIFAGELDAPLLQTQQPGEQQIVIEEFLTGQEVSVLAVTDGLTVRALVPAQDHKQVGEGDTGPNTGGMGAYAPTPIVTPQLMEQIQAQVLEPTLKCLQDRGIDYQGVIYAGLMITPEGEPKVLEFNCRFGDPETQAVLALMETNLDELLLACCEQRLAEFPPITWKSGVAVCVVLVSGGYPDFYEKDKVIAGLTQVMEQEVVVFHAGTKLQNGQIRTDGGRVLGVTVVEPSFQAAINAAYQAIDRIEFEGMYYRRDIGFRIQGI